jgi:ubiquinone/menaquinone biosynthesis C-methylase UbiE
VLLLSPGAPRGEELVDAAIADGRPAIVEGPLPERLRRWLGITGVGPAPPDGSLLISDAGIREGCGRITADMGGRVNTGEWRASDRDEAMDWPNLGVPITAARAAAWAEPGWGVEWWEVDRARAEVLVWWIGADGERSPAIVRREHLIGCCFGLFSFLGQSHTTPPARRADTNHWPRSTGLEGMLCALVDAAVERAGITRARVMPWPAGATWVLSIRHDVDRHPAPDEVATTLGRHTDAGTAATWYWRASHLAGRAREEAAAALRTVVEAEGHEVAHHTEQLWQSDVEEREALEAVARHRMAGTCAHGLRTCFRWQGAPNVMRADALGYLYTEMLSHAHLLPHRFASLREDGSVGLLDVICLPHHESFDRGTQPGATYREEIAPGLERFRVAGGMLQVLNHPDIHQTELFGWLATIPTEGRLDWSARQAVDWWRRTHTAPQLRIAHEPGGFVVAPASEVRGLVVELRRPDGRLSYHRVDAGPDRPARIALDEPGAPSPVELGEVSEWRETGMARWLREGAPGLVAAGDSGATVKSNSTLLPDRAALVVRLLDALGGDGRLHGMRVLDAGCGLGALTGYLASRYTPEQILGVDVRADYVEAARRAAAGNGLDAAEYRLDDVRTLATVADASVDVVLAINSIGWAGGRDDAAAAARAFARVLRPGGRVLVQQASPWRLRDPLAKGPPLHLLPRAVARGVAQATGWADHHGRVRFIRSGEMRRHLRRAGFEQVRVAGILRGRLVRAPAAPLAAYYAIGARRRG